MQDYENWPQETTNVAVSYDIAISTDYCVVLSQCTRLIDRRTDERTDVDSNNVRMPVRSRTVKTRQMSFQRLAKVCRLKSDGKKVEQQSILAYLLLWSCII